MSNMNRNAANRAAVSRQRFGSILFLALLLAIPSRAGLPQTGLPTKGSMLDGQSPASAAQQNLDDPDSSGDYTDSVMGQRRLKMLNNERQKSLLSDSDKLVKLATELNNEIARSNSGSLTLDELHKVAEIEKLAHNVRDKMTMTIGAPSPGLMPIYATPYPR